MQSIPQLSKLLERTILVPANIMKMILVVDDELSIVEVVATLLEQEGYKVLTAAGGKEALACLEKNKVDLVLSDMMMPVMDGRELCKRIGADATHSAIPVVLMSGTHSAAHLDGCRYAAFLGKPFDMQKLLSVVASALREK
ncbi:MAG: response regulator [Chloroflexota bacterium]